jgi:hypothetical protein
MNLQLSINSPKDLSRNINTRKYQRFFGYDTPLPLSPWRHCAGSGYIATSYVLLQCRTDEYL